MDGTDVDLAEGEEVLWWERRRPGLRTTLRMGAFPLYVVMWLGFSAHRLAGRGVLPEPDLLSGFFLILAFTHVISWLRLTHVGFTVTDRRMVLSYPAWVVEASLESAESVETCGRDAVFRFEEPVKQYRRDTSWHKRFLSPPAPMAGISSLVVRDLTNPDALIDDLRRSALKKTMQGLISLEEANRVTKD